MTLLADRRKLVPRLRPDAVNDIFHLSFKGSVVATFVRTWTEAPTLHILTNVATKSRSRRCAPAWERTCSYWQLTSSVEKR